MNAGFKRESLNLTSVLAGWLRVVGWAGLGMGGSVRQGGGEVATFGFASRGRNRCGGGLLSGNPTPGRRAVVAAPRARRPLLQGTETRRSRVRFWGSMPSLCFLIGARVAYREIRAGVPRLSPVLMRCLGLGVEGLSCLAGSPAGFAVCVVTCPFDITAFWDVNGRRIHKNSMYPLPWRNVCLLS